MRRRQTVSRQWLIIAGRPGRAAIARASRLPRGSGVLLLEAKPGILMPRLRLIARQRELLIVSELGRSAARVHNVRELRAAMARRTQLILLSPLHRTTSHPSWEPIARMRAAALARLARRRLVALGGMNERRYRNLARLGFIGWAGISAWSQWSRGPQSSD